MRVAAVCLVLLALRASVSYAAPAAAAERTPPRPQPPRVSARAAVLIDAATATVLVERNGRQRIAPASTTKIMTAIVALERGRQDDVATVSARAARINGSSMGLREGQQFRLGDLLTGMMLRSGNDAAVAVAEHVGGSVEAFVEQMNRKAIELGATATHFVNPHGLDKPDHYTTAYDLALITRYAMRNPEFARLVALREATVVELDRPREWKVRNTNRLLFSYAEADGVKTGTTGRAGNCVVASAARGEQRLIAVVMNAANRWGDAQNLLDWGFDRFVRLDLGRAGDLLGRVKVGGGLASSVPIYLGEDLAVVVPRELAEAVRSSLEVPGEIPAPVRAGQPVGSLVAAAGAGPVGQAPVVAAGAVPALWSWETIAGAIVQIWKILLRAAPG